MRIEIKTMTLAKIGAILAMVSLAYLILVPVVNKVHPTAKVNVCESKIKELSGYLYSYVIEKGHFPDSDKWIQALEQYAGASEARRISDLLKCPSYGTSSFSSYEMNPALSRRQLADFPEKDRKHIVMLREKGFPGSHHWVIFMDRHPESSH
jgi:competence protein ComGC